MKKKIHYTDNYLLNPTHPVTIDLIGIGGTGSHVLASLARMNQALRTLGHAGLHVKAFDDDEVTPSNIGRQLFYSSDIGLNKALVSVTRINRAFGYDWEASPQRYAGSSANITISCVDTVQSRIEIAQQIKKSNGNHIYKSKYWLDFGNTTDSGQVVLGTIGDIEQPKSKKYRTVKKLKTVTEMFDLSQINEKELGPSCSLAQAIERQDLYINSTLCQAGCSLLWKLFRNGMIDSQGLWLNLNTLTMNPMNL